MKPRHPIVITALLSLFAAGLAAQETKSGAPVAAADHLELKGDALGEVTQHDAMMLSAHVPRLVNRLKKSGRAMPAEVDTLLKAGEAAFRKNEHYRAFRLYARAAGLAQGADQVEAYEVAASIDLSLNRAVFAAGDTITLTLQPLFSLGHPLAGRYTATAWLETRTGAIAGTEQKLGITELKRHGFDLPVDGLADGVTAVGYRLSSPTGDTLVEFLHAVVVAQDAQRRGEQLSTRLGAIKQPGGATPTPAVTSALETIAHHLQALEQERTRFDGNWQRSAHPLGMYLNGLNNTADGNPPHRFPVFAGRLRYPEDIVLAENLAEALAAHDEARLRPTGDLTLAYRADAGGELVRYRIFVPAGYDPARKYSLMVALHSGAGEGSYFEWETYSDAPGSQENQFKKLAQEHSCIVACPNGRGNFQNRRGETDVLDVTARVQAVYSIDPGRVFLTGWSLGSNALWRIGLKYPERFRAIAPVAGAATWINRENTTKAAGLPVLFSVAEQDFDIEPARRTAALAKDLLRNFTCTEYPATSHPGVWSKALPAVFAFFDACGAVSPSATQGSAAPAGPRGADTTGPATGNPPPNGELTPLQAQTDYDTLRKALEEAHPGLYRHSTETEINRRFEAHRAQLNRPMSRIDFIGIVSEMLADIQCGHTGLTLDPETQAALTKAPLFPLRMAVEDRRLVVMFNDTPDDTTIRPGMEITEINGHQKDALLDLLLSKLTTDGFIETGKRWRLAQDFGRNYWLFVDRSADFTIKARNAAGEIVTAKLAGVPGANRTRNRNPINATMLANAAKFEGAPENVALRFVKDPAIAHLRIRGFGGSGYPQSVENAFRTLMEKGAKVLILDLRGNGGGNDLYGAMLVSCLRNQPFRYFDHIDQKTPVPSFANWRPAQEERSRNNVAPNPAGGYFVTPGGHQGILEQPPGKFPFPGKVILLMDGRTFSTAADVCATLHHLKRATFVGEESGGGYCGNTSGLSARVVLPNSRLSVTIPMWGYWNAVAETADKHRGTRPDHPVETRVADLLGGVDAPWEKALQLATDALPDPKTAPAIAH